MSATELVKQKPTLSSSWIPHSYQLTAKSFLLSKPHSGLFLDPGLGKTSTTLSTLKTLFGAERIKGVLLIAPLRVIYSVWPGEVEKWCNFNHLTYTLLHEKEGKATLHGPQKNIYLMNPEGLPWLLDELIKLAEAGKPIPFDTLWVDESTKFKSPGSKKKPNTRFNILEQMLPLFKRRHIMTGTPSPRSLLDLWPQIYLLDKGKALGTNFYAFRRKYFYTEDWNKYNWILKEGAAEQIHKLIAPLVLQMSAEDHLDMPELVFNDIYIHLPTKAMRQYKQMEKEFFADLDGNAVSAEAAAQASMKCHQIANGQVYEDVPEGLTEDEEKAFRKQRKTLPVHKAKIDALKDLLDELNGKPLLIAYHYKHDLEALKKALGADLPYIGSGVSPAQAKQIEADWNAGKLPILAGHPGSMGHGLNLQESGNDVCWFSLTWDLENYDQFIRRVYRQGVKGNRVRVHHLIAKGTTDEAMLLRLGDRSKNQEDLRKALKKYRNSLRQ